MSERDRLLYNYVREINYVHIYCSCKLWGF